MNPGISWRRAFGPGDVREAFRAVVDLLDPNQRVGLHEVRIAADHQDNEPDFVFQLQLCGASEFERGERPIVLKISAVDHPTVVVSEIASRRDVGEARAVVRGSAGAHVFFQQMQRVQAVDEHIALDQDMTRDDPPAGLFVRGV